MENNIDDRPVLIVIDKDGYLIQAGDPDSASAKDLKAYAKAGYETKTITISEYRISNFKWIWDKPKN